MLHFVRHIHNIFCYAYNGPFPIIHTIKDIDNNIICLKISPLNFLFCGIDINSENQKKKGDRQLIGMLEIEGIIIIYSLLKAEFFLKFNMERKSIFDLFLNIFFYVSISNF